MVKVYLTYTEDRTGGEANEPGPYASRSPEYIEYSPTNLYSTPKSWHEEIEVDFDPKEFLGKDLFLVVVRYSDGDTFGTTYGHWRVIGVYTDVETVSEVEKEIQETLKNENKYYYKTNKYVKFAPWIGYFSGYETTELTKMTLFV